MDIGIEIFNIEWDFHELDILSESERQEVIKTIPTSCKEFSAPSSRLEDIEDANKEEEFMEHLDEVFGMVDEVEDTELNDYIWFEREYIYESLGLNENGELIEEEN